MLVSILLVLAGASCTSSRPDPQWAQDTIEASSDRVLWDVTVLALEKTDFPVGTGLEPGALVAISGWKNSLEPFRGKGYRERCEIRYTSLEGRKYQVKIRVERDRNMDILRPLDLTYAEWEPQADNVDRARVVLQYIRSLLGTEFEMKPRRKGATAPPRS